MFRVFLFFLRGGDSFDSKTPSFFKSALIRLRTSHHWSSLLLVKLLLVKKKKKKKG